MGSVRKVPVLAILAFMCGACAPQGPNTDQTNPVYSTGVGSTYYAGYLESAIKNYSQSDEVENMIAYALEHMKPSDKQRCYHYVKDALRHSDLLTADLPGDIALDATTDLTSQGFINLLAIPQYKYLFHRPDAAPKGAVMVYRYQFTGHIEIKVGESGHGGYVHYDYNPKALYGVSFAGNDSPLTAVLVKPEL